MARYLTKLFIDEVSCVIKGANSGAKVLIRKSDDDDDDDTPYLFNDIMLRKAAVSDALRGPRDEPDDQKVSAKLDELVAEMIVARPSLHPQHARRWLLGTSHGRQLLALHSKLPLPSLEQAQHTTKKKETEMDIAKVVALTEDALMAQVTKRDDETYAKAFTKKYENDIEFRKQWASLTDAKHLLALGKGMATLKPTSTEVGNTNVVDDSAEAIRLLNEMATKQGRKFEEVFADPNNKALAGRTYTGAHRPTASSTSGSELQRR